MDEKELAFSVMLLYQMWLARSEARDRAQITSPNDLVRRSIFLVEEWAALKPSVAGSGGRVDQAQFRRAFSMEQGAGGSSVVLRDHHGGFVVGASHFCLLSQIRRESNFWHASRLCDWQGTRGSTR
jgi:hypothetical protein